MPKNLSSGIGVGKVGSSVVGINVALLGVHVLAVVPSTTNGVVVLVVDVAAPLDDEVVVVVGDGGFMLVVLFLGNC